MLLLLSSATAQADIVYHWKDRYSPEEQEKLKAWIERTVAAVQRRVAQYPFDVHVFFHRSDRGGEPVPWAHTRRLRRQEVHFHVSPEFPLQRFVDDWTAPHELSHLLIPYLGKRNAWFAEGFASYMQYQVMHEMGVLSDAELEDRYRNRITRAARNYRLDEMPFAEAAPKLRRQREYPTMYWGGAAYFLGVDHALRRNGDSLLRVLTAYVACCRMRTHGLSGLVTELDRLADSGVFSTALKDLRNRPGFPRYGELLQAAD